MSTVASKKGINRNKLIQYAIILAFMLLFGLLPPFGPVTKVGMKVLGIFIGCIVAWAFGEQTWPSFLALFLLGMMEGSTVTGVFGSAVGNTTVHIVLLCLLFCDALQNSGLINFMVKRILATKIARKGPWALMIAFWIAGAVSCGLTNGTVVIIILLWELFYEVVDKLNLKKDSPYVAVGIITIAITCYVGGNIMPYSSFVQICIGVMTTADPAASMNMSSYILLQVILTVLVIATLALFCKYILRIRVDYVVPEDMFSTDDLKMTGKLRTMVIYLVLLVLMLVLPYYLPESWWLTKALSQMGMVGSFVIIMAALSITPDGEGGRMMNLGTAFTKVPYGLICVVATALTMAGQLTSEATGISKLLSIALEPLTSIGSPYLVLALFVVISVILTNLINNIVCATILIPVGMVLVQNVNINPVVMVAVMCLTLQQGIVAPSGSVFGAMLHGIDGYITSKSVYKYGTILELVLALVVGFVGTLIANVIM